MTTIALAGNPNVGKSTIFNILTGSRQHVGNWPGKTVEKKEGRLKVGDEEILIVDLPGTYSLTAYSVEEIITRDFIINEHPTAVVAVIDASNLERNLYLVAQVMELGVPVIIDLNMTDVADSRGLKIDAQALSERLGGVPVIETVGNRSMGVNPLKEAIAHASANPTQGLPDVHYDGVLGKEIAAITAKIQETPALKTKYRPSWLAAKLLEDDPELVKEMNESGQTNLMQAVTASQARIEEATGEDAETLIADRRYSFIGEVTSAALKRPSKAVQTRSDKIDAIVTHRIWGLPIFLLMMWIVFQFTANVSAPYLDWVDGFVNETIYGWGGSLMEALGLGGTWIASLLTDGIIAGVGGVLVFVPVLLSLYLALAVLEDSGYMARAAFVMDRVMRWMGLHGKSFLPMIVGFGCTVPAVYATRTLENEKDRKLTAFLATFMSCGARLPVYVLIGAAFFGAASGNLIFAMYILGIGVALAVGFAFKHTVYKGQPPAPFVMELPPYRAPRVVDVLRQMWARTKSFVIKAGTVILGVSIALWLLMAIPVGDTGSFNDVAPEDSLFGVVSNAIAPIFAPAGFGNWEASGSIITGILAKEVVVGTMNQIYVGEAEEEAVDEGPPPTFIEDVGGAIVSFGEATIITVQEILNIIPRTINLIPVVEIPEFNFFGAEEDEEDLSSLEAAVAASFAESAGSPQAGVIAAVAFTVFVLLYTPCMVAVAAMRQEFGSRWMWAQVIFTFVLAWVAAVIVFQIGTLLFI
ncbi:MAG: ferrous iron transport protein B [Chloroflexi bacterium]|nr:MAG: ferrous iron transport protein B [Chloroflexota bacterium]